MGDALNVPLIIFDRSAMHGQRFDLISSTPLLELCRKNKLHISHTPIFLEESFRMYENLENRQQLKKQLPFIIGICNQGFFFSKETIWKSELVDGHGAYANLYWSASDQEYVINELKKYILNDIDWPDFNTSIWDEMEAKKNNQTKAFLSAREEVPRMLKAKGCKTPLKSLSFAEFLNLEFDDTGRYIIQKLIKQKKREALPEKWSSNKSNYPFLTSWIKGFLYAGYYSVIEQNEKIDKNAQADYESLMYLEHADIIVSADDGFFRSAFKELWGNSDKQLFSPEEFVEYVCSF